MAQSYKKKEKGKILIHLFVTLGKFSYLCHKGKEDR